MKKTFLITYSLLLISIFGLTLNTLQIKAESTPNIIHVDDDNLTGPWDGTPDHPYQNITSALTHASANDTIFVYNGTYLEHLTLNIEISLIGQNTHNTTIDGNGTSTVITITANNVNITGFTIKNSGKTLADAGIGIYSSDNNISHNIITNNNYAIYIFNSHYNTISCNNITGNEYGIYLFDSNYNILSGNDLLNYTTYGIYISDSDHNVVSCNNVSHNDHGVDIYFSSYNTLSFNSFSSNNNGTNIDTCQNTTIIHNNFVNNTKPLSSINSIISLDNGIEGNYWSDYNGTDDDQDGLGDTPYIIDTDKDNHPLMGNITRHTAIYEHTINYIITISNSTIQNFQFNENTKMIKFNVTTTNNTIGFCRITIPKVLVDWPYILLIDDEQNNATILPPSNYTHTFLYFTYNHTTREVKITSKAYYELSKKYNTLLENYDNLFEDYLNLNSTYRQLLTDYRTLNETFRQLLSNYTQLEDDYNVLNQTYREILANYTDLKTDYNSLFETYQLILVSYGELFADYESLNNTFQQLLSNYTQLEDDYNVLNQKYQETSANYTTLQNEHHSLSEAYNSLNQTYQQALTNYKELLDTHNSLNQTYQELDANHTKLQNDHSILQTDYNALLEQYNSLNTTHNKTESEYANTRTTLWYVSIAATAITIITSSLTIKYHKKSKEQNKLIEKYKSELKRISRLDIARKEFEADVQRRKEKIKKFEQKYGATVRTRNTLEDVIKSLVRKKKTKED